jgi:hypothetical protein
MRSVLPRERTTICVRRSRIWNDIELNVGGLAGGTDGRHRPSSRRYPGSSCRRYSRPFLAILARFA